MDKVCIGSSSEAVAEIQGRNDDGFGQMVAVEMVRIC